MKPWLVLAVAAIVFVAPGGAQPAAVEPEGEAPAVSGGEDEVLPEEVISGGVESDEPSWKPMWQAYEDPDSVNCDGRKVCQDAIANATAAPRGDAK